MNETESAVLCVCTVTSLPLPPSLSLYLPPSPSLPLSFLHRWWDGMGPQNVGRSFRRSRRRPSESRLRELIEDECKFETQPPTLTPLPSPPPPRKKLCSKHMDNKSYFIQFLLVSSKTEWVGKQGISNLTQVFQICCEEEEKNKWFHKIEIN